MVQLIQKVIDNPFMLGLLALCFGVCMTMFRARVRREQRADYRRPVMAHRDDER